MKKKNQKRGYPGSAPTPTTSPRHGTTLYPTPIPTSSPNGTPTPLCNGTAEINKTYFFFLPNATLNMSNETFRKSLAEIIKEASMKINSDSQLKDFQRCTYPPNWKCNSLYCKVLFSGYSWFAISPVIVESSCNGGGKGRGEVSIFIDLVEGVVGAISIGSPPTPPDPGASDAEWAEYYQQRETWLSAFLDYIMEDLLEKIEEEINKIKEKYPCPPGCEQQIFVGIDLASMQSYTWLIPPGKEYVIPYYYEVKCIKIKNSTGLNLGFYTTQRKECVNKE